MNFRVIVSVGPALLGSPEKLRSIDALGSCIYRINGSHIDVDTLPHIVRGLRGVLSSPAIMLDLPGNKVRTAGLSEPLRLARGETFELYPFQINYQNFYRHLSTGDIILANDSTLTLEVSDIRDSVIAIRSRSDGILSNNKGLHVRGMYQGLPFLFQKDRELIRSACEQKLAYLSLSYVRTGQDIKEVKALLSGAAVGTAPGLFAKIETAAAVENLGYIFQEVDNVNVDRGDLSADIGILKLAAVQERIVDAARRAGKNVFLATQVLKNMEHQSIPLIAEVIDLHRTIKAGVSGIQLSEETAVGKYPVECVQLVFDVFHQSFGG